MSKTYSEAIAIDNFLKRFDYLAIGGKVGEQTFGCKRPLNQMFYRSKEWRDFRREIILRDRGCDLAMDGYDIPGRILIHHIEPITEDDILYRNPIILDPDNVICVSHKTHEAIHFGSRDLLPLDPIERKPNDTILWR